MATGNFQVAAAQLIALFVECIFYGIYLVTLAQCLRGLLWSNSEHAIKSKINLPLLVVAMLFCTVATLDVALGLRHALIAFVYTGAGGATHELEDMSNWISVMKILDYGIQTIIGDAMLIYRCYVVYDRNWKVILPSGFLWLGGLSCGVVAVVKFTSVQSRALLNARQVVPYVAAVFGATLVLNIITTCLIISRISSVGRRAAHKSSDAALYHIPKLRHIIQIIIESAVLYTISVIVFIGTYAADSNANYVVSDAIVQIIGISFNLIIIRVSSGKSFEGMTLASNASLEMDRGTRHPFRSLPLTAVTPSHSPTFPLARTALKIRVVQDTDLSIAGELRRMDSPSDDGSSHGRWMAI